MLIEKDDEEIDREIEDEDEEGNDSEKKNTEEDEEDTSKNTPPANDGADDNKEEELSGYRPSTDKKVKVDGETVPLKKYLDVKAKLAEVRKANDDSGLSKQTLDEFAEEAGLKPEVARKYAKIIIAEATAEAIKAAEERVAPIVLEKTSRENLDAFEQDFINKIATKYPELAAKKETFKKVAFSKDFLHLKSLEAIKNEFFPDVKAVSKEAAKKEELEGGSKGGNKEVEHIEFSTLKESPDNYKKVMDDPKLRKKYFDWQDSQE